MANPTPRARSRAVEKEQQLPAVFEVAEILVTEQDLEAMLPRFLSYLIATLDAADTGALLLYDEPDGQLVVSAAQGYDFAALSKIHIAPGEATSGKAFQTGEIGLYTTCPRQKPPSVGPRLVKASVWRCLPTVVVV